MGNKTSGGKRVGTRLGNLGLSSSRGPSSVDTGSRSELESLRHLDVRGFTRDAATDFMGGLYYSFTKEVGKN